MANESGTGRALEPTKLDINKFRRSKVQKTTTSTTPDQFGQQYSADYDNSKWSGESPQESRRLHTRSDVDLAPRSLHHTLGTKANQASPGNHNHDGSTSKKLGPLEMDTTSGKEGLTRAVWTIPTSPTVADLVSLLSKFVNFRQV
jgi:hypothetical protein